MQPSFATLWANHPNIKGDDALLDKDVYKDQCAINVGAAFIRSGMNLSGFRGVYSWQKDKPKYPIRAQELANWLDSGTSGLMSRTEKYVGKEGLDKIAGRNGVVFIQNYRGEGRQGDHRPLEWGTDDGVFVVVPCSVPRLLGWLDDRLSQGGRHLVLVPAMNFAVRSLFIVLGTITLGFVFYKTIGPVGHWYEARFAQNDSDLGQVFMAALVIQLLSLVAGGWLGDWVFRKWRQRRLDRQKLK